MSENKRTVEKYMNAFSKSDHEQVLSCLADDIEWEIPGAFHVTGKAAFDKEIENPVSGPAKHLYVADDGRERCRRG